MTSTFEGKTEKGTAFKLFPASDQGGMMEVFGTRMRFRKVEQGGRVVLRGQLPIIIGGKRVNPCVPVTPEIEAWMALEEARVEEAKRRAEEAIRQEEEAIRSGVALISLRYSEGEYLSGWRVESQIGAELLITLGLAQEVEGWGIYVPPRVVQALGENISYPQAVLMVQPQREREAIAAAEKAAREAATFAEAKATGSPVVLRCYTTDCDDPNEECDVDIVTESAMPDGSVRRTRTHTW